MNEETLTRLPPWLREQLSSCPQQGSGVHQWLYCCAKHLLAHFPEQVVYELLWDGAKNSGRPLGKLRREIPSQIKCALPHCWRPRNSHLFIPANASQLDIEAINQILTLSALQRRQRWKHSTYANSATKKPHL